MTKRGRWSANPFLHGNFAPWREEGEATELEIQGRLPEGLSGTYFRNGPNPAFEPMGAYHWFDGDGMIHAIRLRNGSASYANRWVRSRGLLEEWQAGQALYAGLLELGRNERGYKNTANTNVLFHAGKFLALMEAALPTELDPQTLATVGEYNFAGRLQGPMTAHPKVDPESGELFFFGYSPVSPYVTFYRVTSAGDLVAAEPLPGGMPAMVHDFAITEHYAVFFICPLMFLGENIGSGRPVFVWQPERGTLWGVVPRCGRGEEIVWISAEPYFIFHVMNAFESGHEVVVDVVRYPEMHIEEATPESGAGAFSKYAPTVWRYRIDPLAGVVRGEPTTSVVCEFPRIDERFLGRRYRYGYAVATDRAHFGPMPVFSGIAEFDWVSGKTRIRDLGSGAGVGEPVFVPEDAASAESDGYLLTLVYRESRDTSELHVISTADFLGEPVAVVHLPHRVPYGFHGAWVPGV